MFPKIITIIFLNSVLFGSCSAQSNNNALPNAAFEQIEVDKVFYKIKPAPTQKEVEDIRAKVREFVWTHWVSKCSGLLTLENYTQEGEKVISNIEIRRDESETCIVNGKITGFYTSRKTGNASSDEAFSQTRLFTAVSLVRIEIPEDGLSDVKIISADSIRPPSTYRIRLKDNEGKTVQEL